MAELGPRGQADTIAGRAKGGFLPACGKGEQSIYPYRKGKVRDAL